MQTFNLYTVSSQPHQIIRHNYSTLTSVFPSGNILSFLKKNKTYFLDKTLLTNEVFQIPEIACFPISELPHSHFDRMIVWKESLYKRLTIFSEEKKTIFKLLLFEDPKALIDYFNKTTESLKIFKALPSKNLKLDIPELKIINSNTIQMSTEYIKKMRPISLKDLCSSHFLDAIQEYFSCIDSSLSTVQHGDFKMENLAYHNNQLVLFDFECVDNYPAGYDRTYFLNELYKKAKKNWRFLLPYFKLKKSFSFKK